MAVSPIGLRLGEEPFGPRVGEEPANRGGMLGSRLAPGILERKLTCKPSA